MKKNKFSKALKHIKKDLTEVAPANSMSGVYSLNSPGFSLKPYAAPKTYLPDVDGNWPAGIPANAGDATYTRPAGIWTGEVDWDETVQGNFAQDAQGDDGNSTAGLIGDDGTVFTALPPNTRSFILGPLMDGFVYNHGYDAYTRLGYMQKDTRQFVLLAKFTGAWSSNAPFLSAGVYERYTGDGYNWATWDGTATGFTSYNAEFTLAHAQWMRTEFLAGRYMSKTSYRSSGGVGQNWQQGTGLLDGLGYFFKGAGFGGGDGDAENGGAGGGYGKGGDPNIGDKQTDAPQKGDSGDAELWGQLWDKAKKNWRDNTKDLGQDYKDHFDAISDWVDSVKDFVKSIPDKAKSVADTLKLAKSGVEAVPTSANALQQYLNNNDPKHPDYRKNDPRSDNYEGPYEPPTDASWKNDVGDQIKQSIPKWSDMEKRAKESPDGKTELTNFEITSISQNMKPISGNGDMRFHTFLNSLPVSGNEYGDEVPGEDGNTPITTFTLDKDGNIEIVTNYRFSDRDDVSSGGPLMKLYVQSYMNKEKGDVSDPGVFPFYDKDGGTKQVGTTHDINMKLKLNINGGNSSTWPPKATDVKKFKTAGMKLMNSYSMEYKPEQLLTESRTRILREIKKPYVVQEQPVQKLKKYRPNFKGKLSPQNTPDKTASKESDALVMSGNQKGQAWRTADKYWSGYETTERMNVISDRVGHGQMAWDMIVDEARQKNGWKNREIQEKLNQIAHDTAMRDLHSNYESPWGTVIHEMGASTEEELDTVMKDPAVKVKHPSVKNLTKRLKGQIDYKDKPSRKGFPDEPPAKQVDGWHPEYGKKYKYDKLDPVSAVAMRNAPTGDPEIDANVEKAARKPKVKVKEEISDWRSESEVQKAKKKK